MWLSGGLSKVVNMPVRVLVEATAVVPSVTESTATVEVLKEHTLAAWKGAAHVMSMLMNESSDVLDCFFVERESWMNGDMGDVPYHVFSNAPYPVLDVKESG
jgi:hypothetical protein